MADLDATSANTGNSKRKPADAWGNVFVSIKGKPTKLGDIGIPLNRDRKVDALIIKLAEENPDRITTLKLSMQVSIVDGEVRAEISEDDLD